MGEIREYKCTYSNSVGISAEVTSGLGLEFPDAYMHSETMQILARAIKEHDGADFCHLDPAGIADFKVFCIFQGGQFPAGLGCLFGGFFCRTAHKEQQGQRKKPCPRP